MVRDDQAKAAHYMEGYSRNTVTAKDWCKEEGANLFCPHSEAAEVALEENLNVLAANLRETFMKNVIVTADFVSEAHSLIFHEPLLMKLPETQTERWMEIGLNVILGTLCREQ